MSEDAVTFHEVAKTSDLAEDEMMDHMMYNRHLIEGKSIVHLGGGDKRNITPRRR